MYEYTVLCVYILPCRYRTAGMESTDPSHTIETITIFPLLVEEQKREREKGERKEKKKGIFIKVKAPLWTACCVSPPFKK